MILAPLLAARGLSPAFNMLEVGARPVEGCTEPFYALLDACPSSRLAALELDPELCTALNRNARRGLRYYACALGRTEEERTLYETAHPTSTSLYAPDERYAALYHDLEMMAL